MMSCFCPRDATSVTLRRHGTLRIPRARDAATRTEVAPPHSALSPFPEAFAEPDYQRFTFAMGRSVMAWLVQCTAMVGLLCLLPLVMGVKGTMPLVSATPLCTTENVPVKALMCSARVDTYFVGTLEDFNLTMQLYDGSGDVTGSHRWDLSQSFSKVDAQGITFNKVLGKRLGVKFSHWLNENLGSIFKFVLCARLLRSTYGRIYTQCSAPVLFEVRNNMFGPMTYLDTKWGTCLFWLCMLMYCGQANAVPTCNTCFDQVPGCAGGAACPFLTRTAANTVALAAAGGAAVSVASLLPVSYLRHLPTAIIRALVALARRPVNGAPPNLGAMTLAELNDALEQGIVDQPALRNELNARLADPATAAAMITRISAMVQNMGSANAHTMAGGIEGINTVGPISFLVGVASLIVRGAGESYSVGTSGASSSTSTAATVKVKPPVSFGKFSELLMVWQALCHAVGAANSLTSTAFLQQVVWDGIHILGLDWHEAWALFIIYTEAMEQSNGLLHMGNVFAAGSQDTHLLAAKQRKLVMFPSVFPGFSETTPDGSGGAKKWNGKDSPNATRICKTYNFKDAEHPAQHLHKDGTCKFRHACMQWVTGSGKNGMCKQAHPKFECANPLKCQTAEP